ncbi:unnamed protein product, partial [Didymodactylos carnosus]
MSVDVIVVSSSSDKLRPSIIDAAGADVKNEYENEIEKDKNIQFLVTSSGNLNCKKIFFLRWTPNSDETILRQTIEEVVTNSIQQARNSNFKTIAFPAI